MQAVVTCMDARINIADALGLRIGELLTCGGMVGDCSQSVMQNARRAEPSVPWSPFRAELLVCLAGDAHIILNAGGRVTDDTVRSLVISQRFLGIKEVYVIHHTKCGMQLFGALCH